MKKLTTITFLVLATALAAFAQTSGEKEIMKFLADYEQAVLNKDITFAERMLADNYVFSGSDGSTENRAKTLEVIRQEIANPSFKTISYKIVNDSMHIAGNTAVISGTWTWSGVPLSNLNGEPHVDKGRYTMILEKRNGKWLVIAEHTSEAPHDRKLMEAQVLKMSLESANIYKNRDYAAMERIVADGAVFINPIGKVKTKAEVLAEHKDSQFKIESVGMTDQKVRVIGNSSAIETGLVRYKGVDKNGKPFDETERYTTTWVWRGGRWQIVSDHTSEVKK